MSLLGYKATCETCNTVLEEGAATKSLQVLTLIIGFVGMVTFQWQGTDRILAQGPEDRFWALFPYYLSLAVATSVIVGIANYIIRNYFTVYDPPQKNT